MAIKKKTRISKDPVKAKAQKKTQFKKGNTKAKGFGRPKMTDEEKELSLKSRTEWKTMLNKYMVTDEKELKKLAKRKDIPAIDAMVVRSLLNTINSGDQSGMNWFLNHALGKEKEVTNINLSGSVDHMDPKDFTKEELLAMKEIHDSKKSREDKK